MNRNELLSIVAVLLLVAHVRAEDAPAALSVGAAPKNIILISWDGLDRAVVKELLEKEKLPHLAALIKEGARQDIDVKGHATVTKPGHAEMLSGLSAETTGVHTNDKYQPIPEGYTIFERMQKFLGDKDKIRTIMVTGKIAHVGGRGADEVKRDGKKARKAEKKGRKNADAGKAPEGADDAPDDALHGEPFFLTRKSLDVFDAAQRHADETGPLCLKYLAKCKEPRFLAFLHFSDPDHAGHKSGSNSSEYRDAAVTCDTWLGKIVEWVKNEKLYDQTLIYVMTDHGFDKDAKSHRNAPDAWLVTNDKAVTRGGSIADVPATILARFGLDLEKLEPKLLGKPLGDNIAAVAKAEVKPEEKPEAKEKKDDPAPEGKKRKRDKGEKGEKKEIKPPPAGVPSEPPDRALF